MNANKNNKDRKKDKEPVQSPDQVETPQPPQHMDPSKKPVRDEDSQERGKK